MNPEGIIKAYTEVYQVAFLEQQEGSYKLRKKIANDKAKEAYPQATQWLQAFNTARMQGRKIGSEYEVLGNKLITALKLLNLKANFSENHQEESQRENLPKEDAAPKSYAAKLYKQWAEKENYVPDDFVLAHFTGFSWKTFASLRSKLTAEGYWFEKTEGGYWRITKRPTSQAEVAQVLAEVVKETMPQMFEVMITEAMKRLKK